MKTAKQRAHQRTRAKNKKRAIWASTVEAPMIVTMMLIGGMPGAWASGWMTNILAHRHCNRHSLEVEYKRAVGASGGEGG